MPRPRDHEDAARVAISWLEERHRKGWRKAFGDLLLDWRREAPDEDWQLDEAGVTMLSINVGEWLIARGQIHARGALREINGYLLGPDGPFLTPGQKAWIAQLRERPLRLYRVTDVRPDEGLTLVDELDAQAQPLAVRERSGSRSATPGMLLGARLMQVGDDAHGHFELSGATYPFARLRETQLLARVRQMQDGAVALQLHADHVRDLLETEIARVWLAQWFEPAPLPQVRDAATGDPVLLVTDHYRVLDAAALAAALTARADVSGDAQHGWQRLTQGDDGVQRSLAAINPGGDADRIEVFYRTQRLADAGRAWFEACAGVTVQHLTRAITDPVAHLARAGERKAGDAPRAVASAGLADVPPEVLQQAIEQAVRRHYAHWCDEAVPLLGGLTPRQAIATPAGLERVKGLLREYEDGERRQAAAQGRPAMSYQFLWDALGIAR